MRVCATKPGMSETAFLLIRVTFWGTTEDMDHSAARGECFQWCGFTADGDRVKA